jgi:hypothetical protein
LEILFLWYRCILFEDDIQVKTVFVVFEVHCFEPMVLKLFQVFRVPGNGDMNSSAGGTDVHPPFEFLFWCASEVDAAMIISYGHQTGEMRKSWVIIVVLVAIVLFLCDVSCSLDETRLKVIPLFYLVVYLSFWRPTCNLMEVMVHCFPVLTHGMIYLQCLAPIWMMNDLELYCGCNLHSNPYIPIGI